MSLLDNIVYTANNIENELNFNNKLETVKDLTLSRPLKKLLLL